MLPKSINHLFSKNDITRRRGHCFIAPKVETLRIIIAMRGKDRIDGGSALASATRTEEKEFHCFPRRCRSRVRRTISFTVLFWIAEAALILLLNSCNGFVPTGYNSPIPLSFPSTYQQQAEKRWRRRDHSFSHLELAKTLDGVDSPISSILVLEEDKNKTEAIDDAGYSTRSMTFSLDQPPLKKSRRRRAWNTLKKNILFWRNRNSESDDESATTIDFVYDYDVIDITPTTYVPSKVKTTGIMLIHPIGVGISRWYYQRLVSSLVAKQASVGERMVIVVPDLLGSGSACNATVGAEVAQKFPLFNISDWTDQLEALMVSVEKAPASSGRGKVDQWCVVANGGCSPIALQLAERNKLDEKTDASEAPITNLILSSVPRLPFFLKNETTNDPSKVAKSYRTLSGIAGNLFWWYSCRNEGAFIQSFSEKNLIADPKNLGPTWRSNCYKTATSFDGRGKYATFSFLAGTLQDGCVPSLEAVKDSSLEISIIKGVDVRRNRAKSWFWQKPKKQEAKKTENENPESEQTSGGTEAMATAPSPSNVDSPVAKPYETFRDYAEKNGNGGRELVIGGRISLAHEDPEGYADALLHFLFGS